MEQHSQLLVRKATEEDLPHIEALQVRVYKEEGYLSCNHAHSMGTEAPFNDLNLTDIFVAVRTNTNGAEELVGTLSITESGKEGLPLFTRDFPDSMSTLSQDGSKLCVLWRFIVTPHSRASFHVAMLLIMEAILAGQKRNVKRAICAVNPDKHGLFYRSQLGFAEIGYCANVSGLKNAPAVLLFAHVHDLETQYHPLVQKITSIHRAHNVSEMTPHMA